MPVGFHSVHAIVDGGEGVKAGGEHDGRRLCGGGAVGGCLLAATFAFALQRSAAVFAVDGAVVAEE